MQSRGVVTAVRAAAMGLVATGLIEVLARFAPRFDPLYVYLGAIALVVFLDGVLAGALTAIAAVEIYVILYAPSTRSQLDNILFALALFAFVIVVAGALRALVKRNRRRPPEIFAPMPLLLEASRLEEPPPAQSNAEILAALDALRAEVRAAGSHPRERDAELERLEAMLAEAHSGEAAQRSRAATATRELDEERTRADGLSAELTLLRMELQQAREENATLAARVAKLDAIAPEVDRLRADLTASRDENSSLLARITELELSSSEAERMRAELAALHAEREQQETAFDEKLQTIVAHLASDHENDLGQALADKEEARAEARLLSVRLAALQRRFDEDHEAFRQAQEKWQASRQALTAKIRDAEETRAEAEREVEALRASATNREQPPRARILVAHPDADLRRNAQTSLEAAGYEVVTAADGLEALRIASTKHPDVVIADAVMPKMNGRELCQLLKSQEKTADIRVVLLLRNVDEAPKGELLPDDVLRKPVPLETLRTTLASLLAGQRA